MKAILMGLLMLGSCVSQGMQVRYVSNRTRTSNLIRNATALITVTRVDDEDAAEPEIGFRADASVTPIIGGAREFSLEKLFPAELIDSAMVARLRDEGPFEGEDFRAAYVAQEGPCDWVRVDQIPDSDDLQDVVVNAKVCADGIPMFNMDFKSQGRTLKIGFDRR